MIKYVLFDLDGTLTDSAAGIINSIKYAAKKLELSEPSPKTLQKFIGPPIAYSFEHFLGLDADTVRRAITAYREYFSERGIFENRVYDGVPKMLERLRDSGIKLAVATSKPEVFALRIADKFNLRGYFECICGAPLDNPKSAKADVIRRALEILKCDKGSTVMVGDRSYDVAGAAACGIPCIGVLYGYGEAGELESAGAAAVCKSCEELCGVILSGL